jgi:hypothetical protein
LDGSTASAPEVLLHSTRQLMALELFRAPYSVAGDGGGSGLERLSAPEGGPALLWPSASALLGHPAAGWLGQDRIPIFASVVSDQAAESILAEHGGSWTPVGAVCSVGGDRLGSVWRCEDGSVFLPFDPDEVHLNLLSEGYREILLRPGARNWRALAMRGYYRVRGLMPKAVQIWLRRRYAPFQARSAFPRWPVETGLHDFLDFLFSLLQWIAGEPVPRIASWPNDATWAFVLSHDVETAVGLGALDPVLELERSLGLRSAWNFVPRRGYEVSLDVIRGLVSDGFEVGVHGLYHDGRDLESVPMLRQRLPAMRDAASRWEAVGFHSPANIRGWELMSMLGFDYDSSYPDTDPFEPQAGGCCSWLPFFIDGMVELPLTISQDHTVFVILRHRDEQAWVEKAEFLRSRSGMALLVTHPDYLTDDVIFQAYRRFLARFADDGSAWKALPREVSDWWRRRAASSLERTGSEWSVVGPAAHDARIEFGQTGKDWLAVLGDCEPVDADPQLIIS